MSDDFYDVGLSQAARGADPRDRADADGYSMDDELSECRNADCGRLHHDGPGGCCSTACAVEVGRSDDARTGERDDHRATQEVACGQPQDCSAPVFIRQSAAGYRLSAVGFHAARSISSDEAVAYLNANSWTWERRPAEAIPDSVPWCLAESAGGER